MALHWLRRHAPGRERSQGGGPASAVAKLLTGKRLVALRWTFSLAVGAALVVVGFHAVRGISSVSLHVDVSALALAWAVAIVSFPLLSIGWSRLVVAYGHRIGTVAAVRLWCLAQASRYLPTGAFAVASRAVLAARQGVPATASVMTMAVEGWLLVAWSALATVAFVVAHRHVDFLPLAIGGLVAVLVTPGGLLIASRLKRSATRRVPRWMPWLDRLGLQRLGAGPAWRQLAAGDALVGVSIALKSISFVLFARALLPVRPSDWALLVGSTNLAVVAGLIGVTPAGIGVREGVLIALLSSRFGGGDATAMALALRVFDLTVEAPWVLGSLVVNRRSRRQAVGHYDDDLQLSSPPRQLANLSGEELS
jgi:uncharacterized membrane protein YbhN (UPF0104 family)